MSTYESIFSEVETFFSDYINKFQPHESLEHVNICCDEKETQLLINYGKQLKKIHPEMSIKDIFIALLFCYYGLTLGEQTEDILDTKTYEFLADDEDAVTNLFIDISTQDNKFSKNNKLYINIRRTFLGLNPERRRSSSDMDIDEDINNSMTGGKKSKSKSKKSKSKSKKSKSKSKKSKSKSKSKKSKSKKI